MEVFGQPSNKISFLFGFPAPEKERVLFVECADTIQVRPTREVLCVSVRTLWSNHVLACWVNGNTIWLASYVQAFVQVGPLSS